MDFAGAVGNSNSSNQGLEIQFQAPFYDDPPPPNGKKGDIWRVVNAFSADADAPINTIPSIRNEVSFSLKWLSSLLGKSRVSKPNWTHTECKMGLEIESWNERPKWSSEKRFESRRTCKSFFSGFWNCTQFRQFRIFAYEKVMKM